MRGLAAKLFASAAVVAAGLILTTGAAGAQAPLTVEARLAQPVMKSGEAQKNYLRVALNGCEPKRSDNRTPVNVAFVIDRSGSMSGTRIAQAREAAVMAVSRLDANDIASVVVFDNQSQTLIPAQPVSDRAAFVDRIRQIGVRGQTAIHDGVREGAGEVRKFKDDKRLNRVVLLSDGQANVGPSRPADFAQLGRDLLSEGISVSTIGLGLDYNEDLMLQLARASDGNHAFARAPDDLIQIFNREFDDVLAACAQTVSIDVELAPGARVVRAISRDGEVAGGRATFKLNQVYAKTEHYVLMEIALDPAAAAADDKDIGQVRVSYAVPQSGERETRQAVVRGRFSASADEVKAGRDLAVTEAVIEQVTRERAAAAVKLRDEGKHAEAGKLFQQNADEIGAYVAASGKPAPALQGLQSQYGSLAKSAPAAAPGQWNLDRKMLRALDAVGAAGARY